VAYCLPGTLPYEKEKPSCENDGTINGSTITSRFWHRTNGYAQRRAVTTLVQYIQEHQNDVYKEIKKRGIEEGWNLAQNDAYSEGYATGYSDTIQDEYTFEQFRLEGRKEGYEKGSKEGEEQGRMAE
jgi:hypothetical protein